MVGAELSSPGKMNGKTVVHLRPFNHQVGGHYTMMQLDERTVCKPLNSTELQFYEHVPRELRDFVPQYKGVVKALLTEEDRQAVCHRVYGRSRSICERQAVEDCNRLVLVGGNSESQQQRVVAGGGDVGNVRYNGTTCNRGGDQRTEHDVIEGTLFATAGNSLSLRDQNQLNEQRFLMLENILTRFRRPCVLDLKVGRRTHGDDASQVKIDSQEGKCRTTTSSSLGIRICGMQVYDASSGTVQRWDKLYGRKITAETMKGEGLLMFLKPAIDLRLGIISSFIIRLKELITAVEKQLTYRFYSSSLLLAYDAHRVKTEEYKSSDWNELIDVRVIDFAHTTWTGAHNSLVTYTGPDEGYLFGLRNITRLLQDIDRDLIGPVAEK